MQFSNILIVLGYSVTLTQIRYKYIYLFMQFSNRHILILSGYWIPKQILPILWCNVQSFFVVVIFNHRELTQAKIPCQGPVVLMVFLLFLLLVCCFTGSVALMLLNCYTVQLVGQNPYALCNCKHLKVQKNTTYQDKHSMHIFGVIPFIRLHNAT